MPQTRRGRADRRTYGPGALTGPPRPVGPACGTSSTWRRRGRASADGAITSGWSGDQRAHVLAQLLDVRRRRAGRPCSQLPGEPAGAERQRDRGVGLLVVADRDLQRAAADVQHQQPTGRPAEPATHRQEGQPRLVGAGQHLQVDAGRGPDRAQHRLAVGRLADGRRGEGEHLLGAHCPRPRCAASATNSDQRVDAARWRSPPSASRSSARRSSILYEYAGRGARPVVGVDHEQVDGVGTDVEDAESHA